MEHISQSRPESGLGLSHPQHESLQNHLSRPQPARSGDFEEGNMFRTYLTQRAYKVVLQKSIPAQIRQLILHVSDDQG